MNKSSHSDITATGWIKNLPSSFRPYALLMRLDRPIGTWLLFLPALWSLLLASPAIMDKQTWLYMILFASGAIIMRGAGCIINDLWDRDFDTQVERTRARPLASGQISAGQALAFLALLLGLGLSILLIFNKLTVALGIISLVPVTLYPLAKRVTWYPQAILGLTFNLGALMGAASLTGTIPSYGWALYAAGLFWTLGYDTIYAQQDMADDALVGIKSTALKFGPQIAKFTAAFYALCLLLLFLSMFLAGSGLLGYVFMGGAAIHSIWQIRHWDRHDPASSLKIFRSNRDFGLLVAIACLTGHAAI